MTVLLENAYELEIVAREIGAIFLKGDLRYPSDTGGWQLGDLDLDEYLAKFRDRKLVLVVAPISDIEPESVVCDICGFALNELGDCPRCELQIAELEREILESREERDVVDQVADLLDAEDDAP